jgi:hypothetical protein
MTTTHAFRRALAHRLLAAIALSIPAATTASCNGASTGPCDPAEGSGELCFAWPQEDGGAGGAAPASCPPRDEAASEIAKAHFVDVIAVLTDGTVEGKECCYTATVREICGGGRPFVVEGAPRTADAQPGLGGWSEESVLLPDIHDLSADERALLAAAWAEDGLYEHASIASFGRFALELLAAAAPSDLIAEAHRAAADEVVHARLCFTLASAYADEPIEPGAFPLGGRVEVSADLAVIAARAAREGAIGETIAAVMAAEQRDRASDPGVRAALTIIAEDEARHAELAWRTVAWAVRTGGARVRAAVAEALSELDRAASIGAEAASDRLMAHGRLGCADRRAVAARAISEVVRPAARALLDAAAMSARADGASWAV